MIKKDLRACRLLITPLLPVLLALGLQACGPVASEPMADSIKPVKLMTVPENYVAQSYSFVAQVSASDRAPMTFQVPGQVQSLNVLMGERVEQGQLLAALDPTDFELAVAARKAEFQLQQARLDRAKQLIVDQLISADEMDQRQTAYTAAEANLAQARTDLSHTKLEAPFDGVVSITHVKAHQFVGAKQPVLNLLGRDKLDLAFNLPVPIFQRVPAEDFHAATLEATIDSFPDLRLPLTFKEIATQPDLETNTYTVTLTLERPENLNILPGMSALVYISDLPAGERELTLPAGAIAAQTGSQAQIWRFDDVDGVLEAIQVELDDENHVLSGVQPGDQIVVAGAEDLSDGLRVRPWTREGGI